MKDNMKFIEKVKQHVLNYKNVYSVIPTIVCLPASIYLYLKGFPRYIQSSILVILSLSLTLFIFLFLRKSIIYRIILNKKLAYQNGYKNTHKTWHYYNLISDETSFSGINNINSLIVEINTRINSILTSLRTTLQDLYDEKDIFYSVKTIHYKEDFSLNMSREELLEKYINSPFVLIDQVNIRDTSEDVFFQKDLIQKYDFDSNTNHTNYTDLIKSGFYESFKTRRIKIYPKFSDEQLKVGNKKYFGGIIAPLLLFGIPFGFICLGSKEEGVFQKADRDLIATYSDCISEFLRLRIIFSDMAQENILVIINDEEFMELAKKNLGKS